MLLRDLDDDLACSLNREVTLFSKPLGDDFDIGALGPGAERNRSGVEGHVPLLDAFRRQRRERREILGQTDGDHDPCQIAGALDAQDQS